MITDVILSEIHTRIRTSIVPMSMKRKSVSQFKLSNYFDVNTIIG